MFQIRYAPQSPLVLRGITCTFEGGRRIGVVGRTGSGKTTLIGALFRLVEPAAGRIVIDGVDACSIGLHDLRSRLGIIPQEPTLFRGTVRYNLDPLQHFSDQSIWQVSNGFRVAFFIFCLGKSSGKLQTSLVINCIPAPAKIGNYKLTSSFIVC
jgi:ABC-type multidrug transport system fused ATPase/permease subunit